MAIKSAHEEEDKLREMEERYRAIFDGSFDCIYLHDLDGHILDANKETLRLTGYDKEEITALNFSSFVSSDKIPVAREITEKIAKSGFDPGLKLFKIRCKDGEYKYLEARTSLLYKNKKPYAVQGMARDVTDRRKIEKELRLSEEKFRLIAENSIEAIWQLDLDFNVMYVSPSVENMFGYTLEEGLNKNLTEFFPESEMHKINMAFKTLMSGKPHQLIEINAFRKDGSEIPLEVSITPLIKDHIIIGTQGIARDISERKQAEKAVMESEARYQDLVENINDVIYAADHNGVITYISPVIKTNFGYRPDELVGRPFTMFSYPGDLLRQKKGFEKALSGKLTNNEYRFMTKSGDIRWVRFNHKPIMQGGSVIGSRGVLTDITEKKLMENRLIQNEKLSSLGFLVSGIAHEINNPNSFISANIPMLRNYLEELIPIIDDYAGNHPGYELFGLSYPEFREDLFKLLDNMEHGSRRINSTVINLREFIRKKETGEKSWIEPNEFIRKAVSLCENQIRKGTDTFDVHVPEDLPRIFSDPEDLEQVLINLLVNAAQAMDKKNPRISLDVARGDSSQEHLIIEVRDNGCGMDAETVKKVFDPFFTTKRPGLGTGLGLSISYRMIEGLGGRIEIESKPGKGSTFRVILPDAGEKEPLPVNT